MSVRVYASEEAISHNKKRKVVSDWCLWLASRWLLVIDITDIVADTIWMLAQNLEKQHVSSRHYIRHVSNISSETMSVALSWILYLQYCWVPNISCWDAFGTTRNAVQILVITNDPTAKHKPRAIENYHRSIRFIWLTFPWLILFQFWKKLSFHNFFLVKTTLFRIIFQAKLVMPRPRAFLWHIT
jgi:hypothetical protein